MIELERDMLRRLRARRVSIDVPDANTLVLHGVPANRRFFSKPATNLLIKCPGEGMPFLVCVDEDLEYLGHDASLARTFAGGTRRKGWRTLYLARGPQDDAQAVVQGALAAVGFDGQVPQLKPAGNDAGPAGEGLLGAFGTDLSARGTDDPPGATIAREEEIEEVASCLLRWGQAALAVVAGPSGVGKTDLLRAVADRLRQRRPRRRLISVDLAGPLAGAGFDAERENILAKLLAEANRQGVALALEHAELAAGLPQGPLLLSAFVDGGGRMAATVLPEHLRAFRRQPLARRVHVVELTELPAEESAAVLANLRPRLAAHHQVEIDESCIPACVRPAEPLAGCFPAKAIALLDAAAARAALAGGEIVGPDDIYFAAQRFADGAPGAP